MRKYSFLKNYFFHSLKYLFDFPYFFYIFLIFLFYSILSLAIDNLNLNNNLLSYHIIINKNFGLQNSVILVLYNLLVIFFIALVFRFFINMLLFNTQKNLQRLVSIVLTFVYILISFYTLYKFGNGSFILNFNNKTVNFIFLGLFLYCGFYYIIKNKLFYMQYKTRFFIVFFVIFSLILLDWMIVFYGRKIVESKIQNNEFYFVFYNNRIIEIPSKLNNHSNDNINLDWKELSDLIEVRKKSGASLFINNLGDPNSYMFFKETWVSEGSICKNNFESLEKYNSIKHFLPILNFLPNRIVLELFPEVFCLNLGKNFPEIFLYGIYSNIMKSNKNNTLNISFINFFTYENSFQDIETQFDILFSAFPTIKEHAHFYYIENAVIPTQG